MKKANTKNFLSKREKETLILLVNGYSNQEAAQLLNVKTRTIESHRAKIMLKLNLHDLPALVKYCIQNKLTSPDPHHSDAKG